jgi:hypothetical protein
MPGAPSLAGPFPLGAGFGADFGFEILGRTEGVGMEEEVRESILDSKEETED